MNQETINTEASRLLYQGKYTIDHNCNMLIYLIDQVLRGFAPIVLICGRQRMGKSCYGLSLADILTWVFHLERFNVNQFVYFNALRFMKKTIDVRRRIIIIDEASKDLSKSEWYTLLNQVLSKIIETQGDLNNIYIIILPHASRLAPQHKIYIDLKLVMTRRGEAKCFYLEKKYGELSGDLKKIMRSVYFGKWKLPFPPLDLWKAYEKLSYLRKREIAKEEIGRVREKKHDWYCIACGRNNDAENFNCSNCGARK